MDEDGCEKGDEFWSGRRDSNPRPSAWEADTLPLSYARSVTSVYTVLSKPVELPEPSEPSKPIEPQKR